MLSFNDTCRKSLNPDAFLFDPRATRRHPDRMKQNRTSFERLARRALAFLFAGLFVLQAIGLFHNMHTIAALAPPLDAPIETVSMTGASPATLGERCGEPAEHGAPAQGHCDHIGFCALCEIADRENVLFDVPELIAVLTPDDEPAVRLTRRIDRAPRLSSSGLDESRFATAPPRA